MSVEQVASEALAAIRARGTHRRMRVLSGAQAPRMTVDGRDVLLFASSNYLDLAHHPEVVDAATRAARDYGCAAGGSRLITGNLDIHEALEEELADFLGTESALAFNTGYMANVGVIPALVGEGDFLISDSLNHASIIDGARLSRAQVRVFPHGDLERLDEVLSECEQAPGRSLLAIDGVYSMDGDMAPVGPMVERAKQHGAMVLLDDAHGTGTLGAKGRGCAEHLGVNSGVDVIVGTLGKSVGSFGAFVAGPRDSARSTHQCGAQFHLFVCPFPAPDRRIAHGPCADFQRTLAALGAAMQCGTLARTPLRGRYLDRTLFHPYRAGDSGRQRNHHADLRAAAQRRFLRPRDSASFRAPRHRAPAHHPHGHPYRGGN